MHGISVIILNLFHGCGFVNKSYLSMSNVREAGNTRAVRAEPEKHSRETEVLRFTRKG